MSDILLRSSKTKEWDIEQVKMIAMRRDTFSVKSHFQNLYYYGLQFFISMSNSKLETISHEKMFFKYIVQLILRCELKNDIVFVKLNA